jgi:hypothetical protein
VLVVVVRVPVQVIWVVCVCEGRFVCVCVYLCGFVGTSEGVLWVVGRAPNLVGT